jgi:NADPH:quinone reductase
LQEVAQPKLGAGEALVRVHAAGVNYADIYFRNGTLPRTIPFPFTLGIEGAGEIEAVGEGVGELKRGDRVAYKWNLGSYAEHDVLKAAEIAPLPDEVSFDDGALPPATDREAFLRVARNSGPTLLEGIPRAASHFASS